MKTRFIVIVCMTIMAVCTQAQEALLGDWCTVDDQTGERLSVMNFFKGTDGKYHGKVVELCKPEDKNKKIRHGEHKGEPVVGFVVFSGFEFKDGKLVGGKAFNPDDGNWYHAKIWLSDDGCLMLRGGLDKRLILGRTQKWIKKQHTT